MAIFANPCYLWGQVALRDFGLDELLSRQRRSTDTKMKKRMAEDNRIRKVVGVISAKNGEVR